jgi:hypothetical protein
MTFWLICFDRLSFMRLISVNAFRGLLGGAIMASNAFPVIEWPPESSRDNLCCSQLTRLKSIRILSHHSRVAMIFGIGVNSNVLRRVAIAGGDATLRLDWPPNHLGIVSAVVNWLDIGILILIYWSSDDTRFRLRIVMFFEFSGVPVVAGDASLVINWLPKRLGIVYFHWLRFVSIVRSYVIALGGRVRRL